jgi:two-component system LytT family sensor kinase
MAYPLAILASWVINTFIVFLQDFVTLQYKQSQGEIENLQLKGNVTEMSNLLLRQQIHPHFLFNALSTIKSLYKKDPPQGEEYLVHLVSFLRASIANHQTKTTLVKNELDFCMNYLKMQKIRFGDAFNYSVEISQQTINHKYLPYFSLQSLVENALKHNDLSELSPVHIIIGEENGYIAVRNTVHLPKYREPSTGQGLSNLSERYRLMGEEDIVISATADFFAVQIKTLDK